MTRNMSQTPLARAGGNEEASERTDGILMDLAECFDLKSGQETNWMTVESWTDKMKISVNSVGGLGENKSKNLGC